MPSYVIQLRSPNLQTWLRRTWTRTTACGSGRGLGVRGERKRSARERHHNTQHTQKREKERRARRECNVVCDCSSKLQLWHYTSLALSTLLSFLLLLLLLLISFTAFAPPYGPSHTSQCTPSWRLGLPWHLNCELWCSIVVAHCYRVLVHVRSAPSRYGRESLLFSRFSLCCALWQLRCRLPDLKYAFSVVAFCEVCEVCPACIALSKLLPYVVGDAAFSVSKMNARCFLLWIGAELVPSHCSPIFCCTYSLSGHWIFSWRFRCLHLITPPCMSLFFIKIGCNFNTCS